MSETFVPKESRLSVSHAPEETNEQPAEMTPESVLESLGHLEYKMNLSFSTFHHQNLVSKDEKKQLMKTTQKAIEMAEKLDNDPELAQQITSHAYKILAIDAGREYVLTPKKKTLASCLAFSKLAGWESVKGEPWRGQLVASASNASYQQALEAIKSENDLEKAIEAAPKITVPNITGTGAPPKKKN